MNHDARTRMLVTGASGFVGGAVLRLAMRDGHACVTLSRRPIARAGVVAHLGDITDTNLLARAMDGVDVVIHAAGLAHQRGPVPDEAFTHANVEGTRQVAEAAVLASVRHLVVVSSVAVYGREKDAGGKAPDESAPLRPDTPYGLSKRDAERAARAVADRAGLALTLLRPATVIGPGDPGSVAALAQLLRRRRFIGVGDGAAQSTLIDVDDLARACLTCATTAAAGTAIYNVGGWPVSKREMVQTLAGALEVPVPRLSLPSSVARGLGVALGPLAFIGSAGWLRGRLTAWLANDLYDDTRWRARFGPAARTPWPDTLRREALWLREQAR
jgi:nucleoside-diphosphate-sugar epimerase